MDLSLSAILALVRFSVQSPRTAARHLIDLGIPDVARWCLLALVATTSAVFTHLLFTLLPPTQTTFMANAMASPLRSALVQAAALLITIAGVYHVGRWRGGKGSFRDALLLIGWLQFILLCFQFAQLAVFLVAPLIAEIIGLLGLVVSVWLLAQFIAELHGFVSAWRVLAGVFATVFVVAFGASTVIAMLMATGG